MFRTFLSWRYLVARPTNLIGMFGITVAVFALIVILSIMTGFLEENREGVRGGLADVIVQPAPVGDAAPQLAPIAARLDADPRVAAHTARLVFLGILTPEGRFFGELFSRPTTANLMMVEVVGIDVAGLERLLMPGLDLALALQGACVPPRRFADEYSASHLARALTGVAPGKPRREPSAPVHSPFLPFHVGGPQRGEGPPPPGILIGDRFFSSLALRIGDPVQLAMIVMDPEQGARVEREDFVITGTFRSGNFETDTGRVFVDRRALSTLLDHRSAFSEVLVRVGDYERDADALVRDLRADLAAVGALDPTAGPDQVQTWEQARRTMLGAIRNERVMMGIMLSLILLVAGFTIFAILSMMVNEKRRDIGILRSLGATPAGVQQVFLLVACWDALIGATLGGALGVWAALRIGDLERWLAERFGLEIFQRDVFLFDHIPSVVEPLPVALILLWSFVCALGFAALPAWRAARMEPLDALRYE